MSKLHDGTAWFLLTRYRHLTCQLTSKSNKIRTINVAFVLYVYIFLKLSVFFEIRATKQSIFSISLGQKISYTILSDLFPVDIRWFCTLFPQHCHLNSTESRSFLGLLTILEIKERLRVLGDHLSINLLRGAAGCMVGLVVLGLPIHRGYM